MYDMSSAEEQQRVLHSDFDINTHKKTFIDYIEVVIDQSGNILYAVPSHMERLIEIYMKRHSVTRDELIKGMVNAPSSWGLDMSEWLCKQLHCICVWTDTYKGEPNQIQLNKLKTLRLAGVYRGPVYNTYEEDRKKYHKIAKELREFANNYKEKSD